MGKKSSIIRLGILLGTVATIGWAQEKPGSSLPYSIRTDEAGQLVWEIKDEDGNDRKLPEEEKNRLLREVYFPEAVANAEAGKEPEVWTVGFFYADGVATEKDLEKAESILRGGLKFGRADGILFLANTYSNLGKAEREDRELQENHLQRAEALITEVLDAGFETGAPIAIHLASVRMFAWYEAKKDLARAESLLDAVEKLLPENPMLQLRKAKLLIYQKKYSEAFDYAEKAEKGFVEVSDFDGIENELKRARAAKVSAAVLGGEISKIDPEEFMQISKDSLGLNGPMAWSIPVILLLILLFLLWRSARTWRTGDGDGPGLRLSIFWISAAVLAAGIGFNIRLPGLDNGVGHWIGAILVTAVALAAINLGGWARYFGSGSLFNGPKKFFLGLAIIVGCIIGMQLVAAGYGALYEWILGRGLDQQLVSLFLKSENLLQLAGTVLIVGIAIPFYEEVFFRGFLYDALDRRWGMKVALVVSSVLFAVVHGLTFAVPLLFLSFALGWLRVRTGNLRMSFFLHAANNSFSVLVGHFFSSGS